MAPISEEGAGSTVTAYSSIVTVERFRPSFRYLLSMWHLNQRADKGPFSLLQEQELCKVARERKQLGTPLSRSEYRIEIYRFASKLTVAPTGHLNAWKTAGGRASEKWLRGFLMRNPTVRRDLLNDTKTPNAQGLCQIQQQQVQERDEAAQMTDIIDHHRQGVVEIASNVTADEENEDCLRLNLASEPGRNHHNPNGDGKTRREAYYRGYQRKGFAKHGKHKKCNDCRGGITEDSIKGETAWNALKCSEPLASGAIVST